MTPPAEILPLRDIHLPEPVGWWPPAPGWWGLALLCLLLAAALRAALEARRRGRLKKRSLNLLQEIAAQFRGGGGEQQLVAGLSVLLRRVALSRYPRREVAGLTGEDWLRFLDRSLTPDGSDKAFSEGVGRALTEGPYNPACRVDGDALIDLVRRWLARNAAARRR